MKDTNKRARSQAYMTVKLESQDKKKKQATPNT